MLVPGTDLYRKHVTGRASNKLGDYRTPVGTTTYPTEGMSILKLNFSIVFV